jgi:hypothetical protein
MFYSNAEATVSCVDAECNGEMELDWDWKWDDEDLDVTETVEEVKDCPVCGTRYAFILNDWSDTAEDEYTLNIYC